jgi:uncharacterized RDD family membrane protein YckC
MAAGCQEKRVMSTDVPSTIEPSPPAEVPPPDSVPAGLGRRFFAFLVDGLLLGIVGAFVGLALSDTLVRMGAFARLIGFGIALCYFGALDGSLGNGQTIGKRFLRLKVLNAQGGLLSFEPAAIRFAIFAIPFFVNGLPLAISRTPAIVTALLSIVIFGVGAANLYLLIFNRPTRQGLHDLSVGSYVVMAESRGPIVSTPFWKPHWAVVGAILVVFGVVPAILEPLLLKKDTFAQMMADARIVESIDGVQNAGVHQISAFQTGARGATKLLSIDINWTGDAGNEEQLADRVAKLLIENDRSLQNYSKLRIAITRGYDLGIGSHWASRAFAYSPDEWRSRVK